jgi:hypothetical protein
MKAILICVGSLFICLCSTASAVEPEWSTVEHHNFELDAVGSLPAGFSFAKSESGKPGRWTVRSVDDAPSGRNVLVQSDADRSEDRRSSQAQGCPRLGTLQADRRQRGSSVRNRVSLPKRDGLLSSPVERPRRQCAPLSRALRAEEAACQLGRPDTDWRLARACGRNCRQSHPHLLRWRRGNLEIRPHVLRGGRSWFVGQS